jgi:hypothetical protein
MAEESFVPGCCAQTFVSIGLKHLVTEKGKLWHAEDAVLPIHQGILNLMEWKDGVNVCCAVS